MGDGIICEFVIYSMLRGEEPMKLLMRFSMRSSAGVDDIGAGLFHIKGQWAVRDELKTVVSFLANNSVKIYRTLHGVFIGACWSPPPPIHSYNSM